MFTASRKDLTFRSRVNNYVRRHNGILYAIFIFANYFAPKVGFLNGLHDTLNIVPQLNSVVGSIIGL